MSLNLGSLYDRAKTSKRSKYKYVYKVELSDGRIVYQAQLRAKFKRINPWSKYFDNERLAAIAVDKKLLENGEQAVNILVKKQL